MHVFGDWRTVGKLAKQSGNARADIILRAKFDDASCVTRLATSVRTLFGGWLRRLVYSALEHGVDSLGRRHEIEGRITGDCN